MKIDRWGFLVLVAATAVAACGDDGGGAGVGNEGDVVGGPCASTDECASGSECLDEGDFPGGTCTVACESEADCPDGSHCVSSEGGVCLLACSSTDDCRDGYTCEDRSAEEGGGEVMVCNG